MLLSPFFKIKNKKLKYTFSPKKIGFFFLSIFWLGLFAWKWFMKIILHPCGCLVLMENTVHIDRKIRPFGCKIIYTIILPSMNFQKTHSKRERKSERQLKHTPPEVIPKPILVDQITVLGLSRP